MKRVPLAGIENSLPNATTTNLNKSQTKKPNAKEINHHTNHATILTELQQIVELNITNEIDKKRALTIINELRGGGSSSLVQSTPILPPQPPTTTMSTGGFAVFVESSSSTATDGVPMSIESSRSNVLLMDEGADGERPKVMRRSSRRASLAVGGQSSMSSLLTLPPPSSSSSSSSSSSKDSSSSHSLSMVDGERENTVATVGSEPASLQGKRGRGGKKGGAASAAASTTLTTPSTVVGVSSSEQDGGDRMVTDVVDLMQPPAVVVEQSLTRDRDSNTTTDNEAFVQSSSSRSPDRHSPGDGYHGQSNKAPRPTLEASSPALSRRVRSLSLADNDHDNDYGNGGDERDVQHQLDGDAVCSYETAMVVMTEEGEGVVGVRVVDTAVCVEGQQVPIAAVDGDIPAAVFHYSQMVVEEESNINTTTNPPSDDTAEEASWWPMHGGPAVAASEEAEGQGKIGDGQNNMEDKAVASAGKGRGKGRGRGRPKAVSSDDGAAVDVVSASRSSSKGRRASMRFVVATAAGTRKGRGSSEVTATSNPDEASETLTHKQGQETDQPAEEQEHGQEAALYMVSPTMAASSSSLAALSLDGEQQQQQQPVSSSPPSHTQVTMSEETVLPPLSLAGMGQDHDVSLLSLDLGLDPSEAVQGLATEPGKGLSGFSLSTGRGSSGSSSSEGMRRYQALLQWCSSDWRNDEDNDEKDVVIGDGRKEGTGAVEVNGHLVATTDEEVDASDAADVVMGEHTSSVGGRRALVCAAEAAAGLTLGDIRGRMIDTGYPEGADTSGSANSSPCLPRRSSNSPSKGGLDVEDREELMAIDDNGGDDGGGDDCDDHRMVMDHALPLPHPSTLTIPQETDVELLVQDDSGHVACCRHQLEVVVLYSVSALAYF